MKSLRKKILATLLVFALVIPSTTVFAAIANNNQAAIQALAQQIVAQQVAAFQAQGQVLTPEQLAALQQNALVVATQQAQAPQQAAALQAQQAQALQAQQAAALQAQQRAAQQAVIPQNNGNGRTVYIASSGAGDRYHAGPNCPSLRNGATAISLDQALAMGRTPCQMRNCR